jgi:5-(carboxyamino)imidazole ribonucleotide synthase
MEQLVISDFKLGIIAGGQLGKILALTASNWNVNTYILDPDEQCPAASCATVFVKGNHLDFDDVYNFGKKVDMITFEIENINIDALKRLKAEGVIILPDPETLSLIKDKGLQKEFYLKQNIPSAPFHLYASKAAIMAAIETDKIEFPFVQKLRTGGYDGQGVAVINNKNESKKLLDGTSVIEKCIEIKHEISVIVARNHAGQIKCFPPAEMLFNQAENIVEKIICPASTSDAINTKAIELASQIAASLNFVGLLAVEMFIDPENKVWINEIAPRPHNSGHHTIESVITSQYEQLLRAIFNFPLGATDLKMPSVMINLLGEQGFEGKVKYEGLSKAMAIEGVKIHLYGKKHTKAFRKMGHVTVLAQTIEIAKEKADLVKQTLKVKS